MPPDPEFASAVPDLDPDAGNLAGTLEFALGATSEPTDDAPTIISKGQRKPARPDEAVTASLRGKKLAHFEMLEPIGVGGMAAVIRAHDTQLDRIIALKILPPGMAADKESLRRFQHEARAAARLDHENIARVFYCGEDQGLHFIAFEFVEGENLRVILDKRGKLPVGEAIRYMLQVAAGLAHASSRGVVHRDIKPSNIIITPTGRAKLVDMGLARSPRLDGSLTQSGVTLGTFDYISPEQALEPREADVRSDIYSLGCTFYHMLTGQPPVPEGTAAKKLHCHQHVAPLDPRQLNPTIPDDVAAVLARMMAKDPKQRYQQPEHLVQHLLHLAQKSGGAEPPEGMLFVDAPLPTPPQTRPLAVALVAGIVLVALIGLLSLLPSTSSAPELPPVNGLAKPKEAVKPDGLPEPPDNVGKTVQARSDPQPAPPAQRRVAVQNVAQLAEAVKAPSAHVLLAEGKYDLQLKRDEGEVPGLAFQGKDLVLESGDQVRRATIYLKYDAGAKDQPWAALTVRAGLVTLRNLRIEIDAAGTDTPMSAVARLAGRVRFERCEFFQTGFPPDEPETAQLSTVQVGGVANEAKDGLPDLVFDRCFFRGGHQALLFTGLANVQMKNCAFGPHRALVHFRAAAGESELTLDRCSAMMPDPSAVFLFTDGAAAKLAVNYCLLSNPSATSLDAETGTVLIRQKGEGFGRVRFESDSRNVYHNLRAFLVQGNTVRAATLDAFRQLARLGRNDHSLTLTVNPWQLDKPVAALNEPEKAFQASQEVAELRDSNNPRTRMLGVEMCSWGSVYPLVLRPLKEKYVDPTVKASGQGIYPTLSQAIGDAQPGDVILIRTNKELLVQPIRLEDFPNIELTIKPDQGFRPVLRLGPTADTDPAMFRLSDGKLTLENLEIELPPPQAGQIGQTLAYIAGEGQCLVKKCLITMQENTQGSVPRSVFSLADLSKVMRKEPKGTAAGVPRLVLKDGCMVRGEANLLSVRGSQAFNLEFEDGLAVLDGSLVVVDGSPMEPPVKPAAQITLNRVTAYLGEHLFLLRACDRKQMPGLVPTQVLQVTGCLFASGREKNALVYVEGMDNDDQMRRLFIWGDGKDNIYSGFTPMLEQRAKADNVMPLSQFDRTKWEDFTPRELDRRYVEKLTFAGWPAGDRPFSRATATLFRVKAPADLGPCGVDVDRVVRPRPELIAAPPPPED